MLMNYFNPFISVKVMDGLFICNQTAVKVYYIVLQSKDQQFIQNNKFSLIVNTCPKQFKVLPLHNVYKVTNFHWTNSKHQLIESIDISVFKPIFEEISTNLQEGHATLVVSQRGHSRSITFILLYLMTQFQWQLLKSLQYINSKKQNLSVRATYLNLLVNYQKNIIPLQNNQTLNGQSIQNNINSQNYIIHNHLKSSTKQKWTASQIKSQHQQLITNTFKNTIKKRRINDINLQFQQIINQSSRKELKSFIEDKRIRSGDQKRGKSVRFSNEIQIIIGQCPAIHNFPQYGQLEAEGGARRAESQRPNSNQQKQSRPTNTLHIQSTTQRQSIQSAESIQKHRNDDSITKKELANNIRLINVRKKQHQNFNQQKLPKPEIIQLSNDDLYDRGFQQNQIIRDKNENNHQLTQLKIYSNQYLPLTSCMKTQNQTPKEYLNNIKNSAQISPNKSGQFNPYNKSRLSSYKKLKGSVLQTQIKNSFSPLKRKLKQTRVQTEPKTDNQTMNFTNDSLNKKNVHKRLSISQNSHARPFIEGNQLSHQRKSLSLAIQMKPMSIIEKMSIQKGKQKRCQTPQLDATQSWMMNNNLQASHNNLIDRHRGKNNSVRVNKKSGQSQSLDKRIQKEKGSNNIFNVNINVNIGRLQIFGSLNGEEMSRKGMKNNVNLFKINNQFDKMGFINSKPRSYSSSSNYPNTTSAQPYTHNKRESGRNKITQRMASNANRNTCKNIEKHIKDSQDSQILSNKNITVFATSFEDINLGASDSFSKQQIMKKINKKLINKNNQQSTKNPMIKRNNFI